MVKRSDNSVWSIVGPVQGVQVRGFGQRGDAQTRISLELLYCARTGARLDHPSSVHIEVSGTLKGISKAWLTHSQYTHLHIDVRAKVEEKVNLSLIHI